MLNRKQEDENIESKNVTPEQKDNTDKWYNLS
jgi:hypothetical protein